MNRIVSPTELGGGSNWVAVSNTGSLWYNTNSVPSTGWTQNANLTTLQNNATVIFDSTNNCYYAIDSDSQRIWKYSTVSAVPTLFNNATSSVVSWFNDNGISNNALSISDVYKSGFVTGNQLIMFGMISTVAFERYFIVTRINTSTGNVVNFYSYGNHGGAISPGGGRISKINDKYIVPNAFYSPVFSDTTVDSVTQVDTSTKRDHVQVGGETHYIQNDFTGATEFVREYLDLIPAGGRTNSTPSGSTTFLLGREIPNTANNYVPFSKDMYGLIETGLASISPASTQISRDLTTEPSPVGGIPLLLEGDFDATSRGIFTTTGINTSNQYGTIPYMTSRLIPGYIVIPPGQSCNLSVYAKANAPITSGFRFQLGLSASTGTGNGQGFNTLNTSWQRFSFERINTFGAPEVHSFSLQVFNGAATGATKLWLDGIQITFNSGAKPFEASSPNFPTLKMDRVGVGTARALTISKAASGEARTKQTEFTPINYTQDLLQIIQPDL